MILAWAILTETPEKKMKQEYLRKIEIDYSKALIEVKSAIRNKYEMTYVQEFAIGFLKYDKDKKIYYAFYVAGSKEEIARLQLDLKMK